MGVKDFCASVTPGSKPSELFGACNYKILPTGYERSQDIFEQQKVDTSPNGGVLNQVKSSDNKFIVLLNAQNLIHIPSKELALIIQVNLFSDPERGTFDIYGLLFSA